MKDIKVEVSAHMNGPYPRKATTFLLRGVGDATAIVLDKDEKIICTGCCITRVEADEIHRVAKKSGFRIIVGRGNPSGGHIPYDQSPYSNPHFVDAMDADYTLYSEYFHKSSGRLGPI